jgi:hypothetical protein
MRRYPPDSVFKWIMEFQLTRLGIPIQTEVEVSRLPRTIDVTLARLSKTLQRRVRLKTGLRHVRLFNLIEFKSINDPLTMSGLRLILGRANLYMGQNNLSSRNVTITIVCARTPRKVLRESQVDIEFESLGGGYYRSTDKLPVHIIATNELEVTPKNYPLLMFATSKQKFEEFIRDAVGRNDSDHNLVITFAYFLRSELIREIDMPFKSSLSKEALDIIIEDIGDEILSRFSVDEILSRFSVDEILSRLSPEERLTGLSPEERRQLQRLLEK